MSYDKSHTELHKNLTEFERLTGTGNVKLANTVLAKIIRSLVVMIETTKGCGNHSTPLINPPLLNRVMPKLIADDPVAQMRNIAPKHEVIENEISSVDDFTTETEVTPKTETSEAVLEPVEATEHMEAIMEPVEAETAPETSPKPVVTGKKPAKKA